MSHDPCSSVAIVQLANDTNREENMILDMSPTTHLIKVHTHTHIQSCRLPHSYPACGKDEG